MYVLQTLLSLLFLVLTPDRVLARELEYAQIHASVPLHPYTDYLVDKTGTLTIEDIRGRNDADFLPTPGDMNFGYTNHTFWFRFKMTFIPEQAGALVLLFGYALVDEITMFIPDGQGGYAIEKTGRNYPMHEHRVKNRLPSFLITPSPNMNDQFIYFRGKTVNSSQFPMTLMHLIDYANLDHDKQMMNALYFGAILLMAVYNLVFWAMTRMAKYFYYVIFVIANGLLVMAIYGYNFEYLWPEAIGFNKISVNLIVGLNIITGNQFYISSLSFFDTNPRLRRYTQFLSILTIPVTASVLFLPYGLSIKLTMAFMCVAILNLISITVYFSFQRYRTAYFFTLAFASLLIGTIIYILKAFGLVQNSVMTEFGPQMGSAIQIALFSLALADQFREMKEEKEEAQKNILKIQGEHIRTLDARVDEKTRDIRSIFSTIQLGIFTISKESLAIDPEYSDYLASMFGRSDLKGTHSLDLLFAAADIPQEIRSQNETVLMSSLNEEAYTFQMNEHLLVHEYERKIDATVQSIQLEWTPILSESGRINKILATVKDMTELKELEKQSDRNSRDTGIIKELISSTVDKASKFLRTCSDYFAPIAEFSRDEAFIMIHTFKGEARTLGLTTISNQLHLLEESLQTGQSCQEALRSTRILIEEYRLIGEEKLGWVHGRQLGSIPKENLLAILASLDTLDHEGIRRRLYASCYESMDDFLKDASQPLGATARLLGKEKPQTTLQFAEPLYLKEVFRDRLAGVFLHLFRNSCDHGLETAEERKARGKRTAGMITIAGQRVDAWIILTYEDDGRGLDLDKLLNQARERQLIKPTVQLTDQEIAALIFKSGFSSARSLTEISGRGIGMSAVDFFISSMQGTLTLELKSYRTRQEVPFRLVMRLPADNFV